jgi:hypothetical protein
VRNRGRAKNTIEGIFARQGAQGGQMTLRPRRPPGMAPTGIERGGVVGDDDGDAVDGPGADDDDAIMAQAIAASLQARPSGRTGGFCGA